MRFSYPGLSDNAVSESRNIYGANVVTTQEAEGFFDKLRTNLKDPIIVILIVALAVTVFWPCWALLRGTKGSESRLL